MTADFRGRRAIGRAARLGPFAQRSKDLVPRRHGHLEHADYLPAQRAETAASDRSCNGERWGGGPSLVSCRSLTARRSSLVRGPRRVAACSVSIDERLANTVERRASGEARSISVPQGGRTPAFVLARVAAWLPMSDTSSLRAHRLVAASAAMQRRSRSNASALDLVVPYKVARRRRRRSARLRRRQRSRATQRGARIKAIPGSRTREIGRYR